MPTSALRRFLIFRVPLVVYMGYIFFMSSGPVEAEVFSHFADYVLHAAAYGVFYVLAHWAVHEGLPLAAGRGGYWLPWFVTVLYGASDELHQSFVPSRQCSAADLLADAVGGLLGIVGLLALRRAFGLWAPSQRNSPSREPAE